MSANTKIEWSVEITHDGKTVNLGTQTAQEASYRYQYWADPAVGGTWARPRLLCRVVTTAYGEWEEAKMVDLSAAPSGVSTGRREAS